MQRTVPAQLKEVHQNRASCCSEGITERTSSSPMFWGTLLAAADKHSVWTNVDSLYQTDQAQGRNFTQAFIPKDILLQQWTPEITSVRFIMLLNNGQWSNIYDNMYLMRLKKYLNFPGNFPGKSLAGKFPGKFSREKYFRENGHTSTYVNLLHLIQWLNNRIIQHNII